MSNHKKVKLRYTGSLDIYDSKLSAKNNLSSKNLFLKPINTINKHELEKLKTCDKSNNNNLTVKSSKTRQYKISFSYTCNSDNDELDGLVDPEIVNFQRLDESTTNSDREFVSAKLKPVMTKVIYQLINDYKQNKSSDNKNAFIKSIESDQSPESLNTDDTLKGNDEKHKITSILNSYVSNISDDKSDTFKQNLVSTKYSKSPIKRNKNTMKYNCDLSKDEIMHYYYDKPVEIFILKHLKSTKLMKSLINDMLCDCSITKVGNTFNEYKSENQYFNLSIQMFLSKHNEIFSDIEELNYVNYHMLNKTIESKFIKEKYTISDILFQLNHTEINTASYFNQISHLNCKNQVYLNVMKYLSDAGGNIDDNDLIKQLHEIIHDQKNKIPNDQNLSNNVSKQDVENSQKSKSGNANENDPEFAISKTENQGNKSKLESIFPIIPQFGNLKINQESTVTKPILINTSAPQYIYQPEFNKTDDNNYFTIKHVSHSTSASPIIYPPISHEIHKTIKGQIIPNLQLSSSLDFVKTPLEKIPEKHLVDKHHNTLLQQYRSSELNTSTITDLNHQRLLPNKVALLNDTIESSLTISENLNEFFINPGIIRLVNNLYGIILKDLVNEIIDESIKSIYKDSSIQTSIFPNKKVPSKVGRYESETINGLYQIIFNNIENNIFINMIDMLQMNYSPEIKKQLTKNIGSDDHPTISTDTSTCENLLSQNYAADCKYGSLDLAPLKSEISLKQMLQTIPSANSDANASTLTPIKKLQDIMKDTSNIRTVYSDMKYLTTTSSSFSSDDSGESLSTDDTENDYQGNMETISYEREFVLGTLKVEDKQAVYNDLTNLVSSYSNESIKNTKLKMNNGVKTVSSTNVNKDTNTDVSVKNQTVTVLTRSIDDKGFDETKLIETLKEICGDKSKTGTTLESKLNDIINLLSNKTLPTTNIDSLKVQKSDDLSVSQLNNTSNPYTEKIDKLVEKLEKLLSTHDKILNNESKIDIVIDKLEKIIEYSKTNLSKSEKFPSSNDKEVQVDHESSQQITTKISDECHYLNTKNNEILFPKDIIDLIKQVCQDPKRVDEIKFNELNKILIETKEALEIFKSNQVLRDTTIDMNDDKVLINDLIECITEKFLNSLNASSNVYPENKQIIDKMLDKLKNGTIKISDDSKKADEQVVINPKTQKMKRTKMYNPKTQKHIKTSSLDSLINYLLKQKDRNGDQVDHTKPRSLSASELNSNSKLSRNNYLQHTIASTQNIQPIPAVKFQINKGDRDLRKEITQKTKRLILNTQIKRHSNNVLSKDQKCLLENIEKLQNNSSIPNNKRKKQSHNLYRVVTKKKTL